MIRGIVRFGWRRGRRPWWVLASVVSAIVAIPALSALANHADHCEGSEPGPNNGRTVVVGTSGDDRCLVGANGPDTIKAKGGDDVLIGNHGQDVLIGGPGDDRFWGGRGPETFDCGPGFDRVHNRRDTGNDVVFKNCEVVR